MTDNTEKYKEYIQHTIVRQLFIIITPRPIFTRSKHTPVNLGITQPHRIKTRTDQQLVDSLYIKPNVDIYIAGSNAYMLSGELATLLTGRYVEINLLPLQFTEYNDFIHTKSPNLSNIETLANFIHYGSVPEYFKQLQIGEKQADLFADSILKTIVEKDIFQRLNITNRHDFNKILDFIFDSVGSYVSLRSISDTLRSNGTTKCEIISGFTVSCSARCGSSCLVRERNI